MIVLLEPICHDWTHEMVNAGFLKLINKVYREKIVYVGEKEHIKCVKKLYKGEKINFKQINDLKSQDEADQYNLFVYYFRMLNYVIKKYKSKHLFLLCAYRPCILAAEITAFINKSYQIHVVLHGMVEEYKGNTDSYRRLIQMSKYIRNIDFLTYSPYCNGTYWNVSEDRIHFIHHPYINRDRGRKGEFVQDKLIIGIIGACANSKAFQLINCVNNMGIKGGYEFWVASRFGKVFDNLPHVKILNLEFERKEMEGIMAQMDYLLLPYSERQYALSASGVLWDAVANQIPCLMLNSHYFEYYRPYNIGYQEKNIQKLAETIGRITSCFPETEKFFSNLENMDMHNFKVIKDLLS